MTDDGKHGALPFDEFEQLVRAAATRPVSFHFEKAGAQRGLPADVLTVMFGEPDDGIWYNVRKGEVPEEDVWRYTERVMTPREKMEAAGLLTRVQGRRFVREKSRMNRKIQYWGWRSLLGRMLAKGIIRETAELRKLLGNHVADQARHIEKIANHKLGAPIVHTTSPEGAPMFMLGDAWKG